MWERAGDRDAAGFHERPRWGSCFDGSASTSGFRPWPPAEELHAGVPYVRGWRIAHNATIELAAQLVMAGLDDGFGALKAEVNVHGDGLVNLGPVPADTVHRLATLLANGLCVELDNMAAHDEAA